MEHQTKEGKEYLYSQVSIDRSGWAQKCLERNPEIGEMKERLHPIHRATALGKEYHSVLDPKKHSQLEDDVLNPRVVLQLVLQHFDSEGLITSREKLEEISKQKCVQRPEVLESRLLRILRMTLKDTERIWDLTMDDKFATSKQNFRDLQDHLMDLDLLAEDVLESEEVSVWAENPFNILTEVGPFTSIKASSFNNLIIKLTDPSGDTYDPQLMSIFLYTYRTFTTPEKVLQKLLERFQDEIDRQVPSKPLEGETEEEWKEFKRTVQLKVVGFLKKWITDLFDDFRNSDKLMKKLEEFIEIIESDPSLHHLARALQTTLNTQVSLKTIFSKQLEVIEVEEEEIARQLTLIEFELYASIKHTEFLGLAWSKSHLKHRAPNVLRMIDRSTKISQWVATTILKEEKIRKRARILGRFIKIAEHLVAMNNFSTGMAVLAGLNSSPVHRLKFTAAELPRSSMQTWSELEQKLSSAKSYKVYRSLLAGANPPCIPYLGTYLTDLTFIDEVGDTYKELIHFNKRKQIYDVFERIKRYQLLPYNFISIEQIRVLLETKNLQRTETEEERYKMSILREPRNADRSEIL